MTEETLYKARSIQGHIQTCKKELQQWKNITISDVKWIELQSTREDGHQYCTTHNIGETSVIENLQLAMIDYWTTKLSLYTQQLYDL